MVISEAMQRRPFVPRAAFSFLPNLSLSFGIYFGSNLIQSIKIVYEFRILISTTLLGNPHSKTLTSAWY